MEGNSWLGVTMTGKNEMLTGTITGGNRAGKEADYLTVAELYALARFGFLLNIGM